MNYLAHALLSGEEPHWIVGGYLGDHVRGRDWQAYPAGMAAGIVLHRRIDSAVDRHRAFRRARARLKPPFRRFGGILIDMYFDHCLARRWAQLGRDSLERFAAGQYRLLRRHRDCLPATLQRFSDHMERYDLLVGYRDARALERALRGVGTRLSRDNPLHRSMPELERIDDHLVADFEQLWPDMVALAAQQRALLGEQPPGNG